MADEPLPTYLNDHLVASVAALELLEHRKTSHSHISLGRFLAELRGDIALDRQELESLRKG